MYFDHPPVEWMIGPVLRSGLNWVCRAGRLAQIRRHHRLGTQYTPPAAAETEAVGE